MSTSQHLLHVILHLNREEATDDVWASRALRYISAALPVVMVLEEMGYNPSMNVLELDEAERIIFAPKNTYGAHFSSVCHAWREALISIPGYDLNCIGKQKGEVREKLGFLTMQTHSIRI